MGPMGIAYELLVWWAALSVLVSLGLGRCLGVACLDAAHGHPRRANYLDA